METLDLFAAQEVSPLYFEEQAKTRGYQLIAGIDEAGRGPLAGPVVAAAVILPDQFELPGLTDSKALTEKRRETLYPLIRQQALACGIGVASPREIDDINILQATLLAMQRAVARLAYTPDYLLIDGITPLPLPIPQQTLKKGDSRSLSVAAASVVAKVVRDRIMVSYDKIFPAFGFAKHKGYGTKQHLQVIADQGPCVQHRKTFGGVREHVERCGD